ncbi:LPS-assembly protein LptD [Qipengyuania sp.]|uniref:LPS-assembly protein LptD n=1 Tax=Qipengyuania sp. TaxID=2004515 RepID=UPI0035C86539
MQPRRVKALLVPRSRVLLAASVALCALNAPMAIRAQQLDQRPLEDAPVPPPAPETNAQGDRQVAFEADQISYNENGEILTATGNVVLRNGDRSVRSDTVTYNRSTGQIEASGRVRFVDESGNQLFTDRVELTDEFEAGAMEDLLIALRQGGRLAAASGSRGENGEIELTRAAYSACPVETAQGCPKDPTWRITADQVTYDPSSETVRFRGAYLEIFGARLLPLPRLSISTTGGAQSGFVIPNIEVTQNNGVEISQGYYWRPAPNQDLIATATVFTEAPPMLDGQWRHLTDAGAYQITAYLTASKRTPDPTDRIATERDVRGYLFTNGRFQLDPNWSLAHSVRLASDRTFLRRYDISYEDRLRSTVNVERIDDNSYFSAAGWYTQTLRPFADQDRIPIALPAIDYRRRFDAPIGGTLELQANTLALFRPDGRDVQRGIASAEWNLHRVTGWGQVLEFSALARGDLYHSSDNVATTNAFYAGEPGWQGRAFALGAIDISWPLVGAAFGGTQILTPRVQIVAAPPIRNLRVPNEDSRAFDLEDTNLFALNRFPGYDRIEDGTRITYGLDWQLFRPGWEVQATIGQSYRISGSTDLLIDGTGTFTDVSDIVGRTQIKLRNLVRFTHRYRLDKDSLAIRRNEVDATVGSRKTYFEVGYLRLNRDIIKLEDLADREELRAAARVGFANYWSVFGSGEFNLTDAQEDPNFTSNGFQPIRTRLGVAYRDECLELGLTWRRDYIETGDARRGNSFQVYFALRNLGFR